MILFAYQDDFSPFGISTGPYTQAVVDDAWTKSDTITDLVDGLSGTIDSFGPIDKLMLVAHGNAGVLWIAEGLGPHGAERFSRLKGKFLAGGSIELHGCGCASDTNIGWLYPHEGTPSRPGRPGYTFINALARNAGVPVTAPVDCQMWGRAAYEFQGTTMTVYPNGEYVFDEWD